MKNQILKCAVMTIPFLLGPVAAHAACPQRNLAGTWETFITEAEEPDSSTDAWRSCSLAVDGTGNIVTGSSCVSYETDTGQPSAPEPQVSGSIISAVATCSVTGTINIGGDVYTIFDGQIDRGKANITGVGMYPSGHFSFTAVRR